MVLFFIGRDKVSSLTYAVKYVIIIVYAQEEIIMKYNPLILTDFYKVCHRPQYSKKH